MIDTDRYKGHAKGEWVIEMNDTGDGCAIHAQDYGTIAQTFYRDHDKLFLATTKLIADAPLLLEEVKRLRDIVCLLEDSRIRGLSIFDRPQLFDDVLQIHTQRNEQGNGDLPPFECVGEEE